MFKAFVIASGPSLTEDDCAIVKSLGWTTVVTNRTFEMCPWADYLYAYDDLFWTEYGYAAKEAFKGEFIAPRKNHATGFIYLSRPPHEDGRSSGAGAVAFAATLADEIYLLGFDCQEVDGKRRWHGDYGKRFPSGKIPNFSKHLEDIIKKVDARVFNCTRNTQVDFIPRIEIEALRLS